MTDIDPDKLFATLTDAADRNDLTTAADAFLRLFRYCLSQRTDRDDKITRRFFFLGTLEAPLGKVTVFLLDNADKAKSLLLKITEVAEITDVEPLSEWLRWAGNYERPFLPDAVATTNNLLAKFPRDFNWLSDQGYHEFSVLAYRAAKDDVLLQTKNVEKAREILQIPVEEIEMHEPFDIGPLLAIVEKYADEATLTKFASTIKLYAERRIPGFAEGTRKDFRRLRAACGAPTI